MKPVVGQVVDELREQGREKANVRKEQIGTVEEKTLILLESCQGPNAMQHLQAERQDEPQVKSREQREEEQEQREEEKSHNKRSGAYPPTTRVRVHILPQQEFGCTSSQPS